MTCVNRLSCYWFYQSTHCGSRIKTQNKPVGHLEYIILLRVETLLSFYIGSGFLFLFIFQWIDYSFLRKQTDKKSQK